MHNALYKFDTFQLRIIMKDVSREIATCDARTVYEEANKVAQELRHLVNGTTETTDGSNESSERQI